MILVTGGAGYVGSHTVSQLQKVYPKDVLLVVDNLVRGHREALSLEPKQFFECDIGDRESLRSIFSQHNIDAVLHFAGSCYVSESQSKPLEYYQNNVSNSLALFRCMEEAGVRKLVFSSSCAVYGNPAYTPIDESHSRNPVSTYGLTKLIIEQMLDNLAQNLNWSYVSLRYFNAAGADNNRQIGESHLPEPHLLPRILKVARGEAKYVEIYGDDFPTPDGTCIRDYVHVLDLADAHIAALQIVRSKQSALAINLGTSTGVSVKDMIVRCEKIIGKGIPIKKAPRRSGDPSEQVADFKRAKTILSWQPRYDLSDMIKSAWEWELNRRY